MQYCSLVQLDVNSVCSLFRFCSHEELSALSQTCKDLNESICSADWVWNELWENQNQNCRHYRKDSFIRQNCVQRAETGKKNYQKLLLHKKRSFLTREILLQLDWRFTFKTSPGNEAQYVKFFYFTQAGEPPSRILLMEDFRPNIIPYWKIVDIPGGGYGLDIHQFPTHVITRTDDGRWKMENDFVQFLSMEHDEVPDSSKTKHRRFQQLLRITVNE